MSEVGKFTDKDGREVTVAFYGETVCLEAEQSCLVSLGPEQLATVLDLIAQAYEQQEELCHSEGRSRATSARQAGVVAETQSHAVLGVPGEIASGYHQRRVRACSDGCSGLARSSAGSYMEDITGQERIAAAAGEAWKEFLYGDNDMPQPPQHTQHPQPLFVWDVGDRMCSSAYWWNFEDAAEWWRRYMPDYDHTYRAEFYLIDMAFVMVYRYATLNGRVVVFPPTGQASKRNPELVPLWELPPINLRTGCQAGSCPLLPSSQTPLEIRDDMLCMPMLQT